MPTASGWCSGMKNSFKLPCQLPEDVKNILTVCHSTTVTSYYRCLQTSVTHSSYGFSLFDVTSAHSTSNAFLMGLPVSSFMFHSSLLTVSQSVEILLNEFCSNFLKAFRANLKACLGLVMPNQYCHCLRKLRLVFGWCYFVGHAYFLKYWFGGCKCWLPLHNGNHLYLSY